MTGRTKTGQTKVGRTPAAATDRSVQDPDGKPSLALVWLRQDLRLADHRPLIEALGRAERVLPVFVLDDEAAGEWAPGGASRWWLHHSLTSLAQAFEKRGATLVLRRGKRRQDHPGAGA